MAEWQLAGTKPWVNAAAREIGTKFGIQTIYGVGSRSRKSDHPLGLATDIMVPPYSQKGDEVAAYCIQNWDRLGIKYIIWRQRILNSPTGQWRHMADRGGVTENHYDHVHVSYNATAPAGFKGGAFATTAAFNPDIVPRGEDGTPLSGGFGISNPFEPIMQTLSDPNLWKRVAMIVIGLALIIIGIGRLTGSKQLAQTVASMVGDGIKKVRKTK